MLSSLNKRFEAWNDKHVGLLAEFSDPGALLHAVERLRERGYRRLDTFTPFPVHGMDRAMGLPPSKLGFIVFATGALGTLTGALLQWWTGAVTYPIVISNKPLFAWEPSIPIIFELTVLFAALGAVVGMLALNALPKPFDPLFYSDRFARATDDGFFLHVAATDGQIDRAATAQALFDEGALAVEYVRADGVEAVGPTGERAEAVTPSHTTGAI